MRMETYRFTLETQPSFKDIRYLGDRLYDYNVEHTGRNDGQWLAFFARDGNGEMVAGLHGWTWAGWVKVNYLWVSAADRRRGLGRQLLMLAEAEARKRGCRRATLNTYSFQAPEFYCKLGYRIIATIEGLPEGHRQYTLEKDLSAAGPSR
jgi:GNAT superfamily N-acetyltransferase